MEYKEIFDKISSLTSKYIVVKGMCDIIKDSNGKYVFKEFDDCTVYESTGNYDEDLMREAFTEESEFNVGCEGLYEFKALLTHSPAQIGNYPPPNIEVPEYYELDYIEFKFYSTKEEQDLIIDSDDVIGGFLD